MEEKEVCITAATKVGSTSPPEMRIATVLTLTKQSQRILGISLSFGQNSLSFGLNSLENVN